MGWLSHPSESRTLEYKTGQTIWEKKNKSWDLRTRAKECWKLTEDLEFLDKN